MNQKLAERVVAGILLVIAAGMAIHTPLTVWLGTLWPEWELVIKAWKEVLMGVALVLLIVLAVRRQKLAALLGDRLLQLSLVFAGLHFVMMMVFQNGLVTAGAGLLIDLRFVLYFVLVYTFLSLFPSYHRLFIKAFAVCVAIVIGFAALQAMLLPKDILAHIGYSKETIEPYLTVDENPALVRVNSTLRGPNPLGAFAVIVIALLAAIVAKKRVKSTAWRWGLGIGVTLSCVALWVSYSRSSVIAAVVALAIIVIVAATPKVRQWLFVGNIVVVVTAIVLIGAFRESYVVSNVVFHDNPTTGAAVDSNAGHAESLADGLQRMVRQPLGAGVGSTGSASLLGDSPVIIENQYLLVAHEVGWLGLGLFVWLFVEVLRRLWVRRRSALALGVFASGIGLGIIGLLLPVWTDDTVSMTWWGLAAVAATSPIVVAKSTHKKARKNYDA